VELHKTFDLNSFLKHAQFFTINNLVAVVNFLVANKFGNENFDFCVELEFKVKPTIADSTTTYSTLAMSQMEESMAHQNQQDQPDSSSEIPMFTMIPPDGQSSSSSQVVIKNDTNNNNDRNNNNGKSKLEKMTDDDGNNNNHHKRQALTLNNLQRYQLDNGTESPHHPSSSVHHHHHHLLLLQQQQQMSQQQMNHMDKQAANLIPVPDNSPSLIVLQPSGQGGSATYSPFFNHYATGK
jgi:hypothetical protein